MTYRRGQFYTYYSVHVGSLYQVRTVLRSKGLVRRIISGLHRTGMTAGRESILVGTARTAPVPTGTRYRYEYSTSTGAQSQARSVEPLSCACSLQRTLTIAHITGGFRAYDVSPKHHDSIFSTYVQYINRY
jgi:hypothetical protein